MPSYDYEKSRRMHIETKDQLDERFGPWPRSGYITFDSLTKMAEHVEKLPENGKEHVDSYWCSTTTDKALKYAKDGWPEGARIIAAKASQMVSRLVNKTSFGMVHEIGYDVTGAAYDPGAIALGQPEAWGTIVPENAKRAIRIVLNCGASGGVHQDVLQVRGIAVASLAWMLNLEGYSVTIDVMQGCHRALLDEECSYVRLADATTGSQLDLDRLAFGLGHPALFRRLWAAVIAGHRGNSGGSYWGGSMPLGDVPPRESCDLYIGGTHLHDAERWSDGGEAWILQEFERQTSK